MALHSNIIALFSIVDARTNELISLFHLPCIKLVDFDASKPISYYYNLADYTNFNENYKILYDRFVDFAARNGLKFSSDAKPLSFSCKIIK